MWQQKELRPLRSQHITRGEACSEPPATGIFHLDLPGLARKDAMLPGNPVWVQILQTHHQHHAWGLEP